MILRLALASLVSCLVFLCGCGASAGTGLDKITTEQNKTVTVNDVLAVDDLLIGSSIQLGLSLNADGKINPLSFQNLTTGTNGKTGSFSIALSPSTSILYFQASSGSSGSTALSTTTFFTGCVELGTSSETLPRININPFTSLVSYAKFKNPNQKLSSIAFDAIAPFFNTTSAKAIDINTSVYSGTTSSTLENGDGLVLQFMNELLKQAALAEPGNAPQKVSDLTRRILEQTQSNQKLFAVTGSIYTSMAQASRQITTASSGFFSQALSLLATSTGSITLTTFVSAPLAPQNFFLIQDEILLDEYRGKITSFSQNTANLTSSSGAAILLTSLPKNVRMVLQNDRYKPSLTTRFVLDLKKSDTDFAIGSVTPTLIDASKTFTVIFPAGATVAAQRVKPDSASDITTRNLSEDRYVSTSMAIDIPVDQLLKKAESASGQTFSFANSTLRIQIKFDENLAIRTKNDGQDFFILNLPELKITQ